MSPRITEISEFSPWNGSSWVLNQSVFSKRDRERCGILSYEGRQCMRNLEKCQLRLLEKEMVYFPSSLQPFPNCL